MLGVDLVHIPTLRRTMQRNPHFAATVFTPDEIAYCEARGARRFQHYAARLAAKEAYWKATQDPRCDWRDVEVLSQPDERPLLRHRGGTATALTLSHHGAYAVAVVMVSHAHDVSTPR